MSFIADVHIHSRFSRATSRRLTPRHLAAWAQRKGIAVLGTGDFTHPQWRAELAEQLVRDEASGLYRLAAMPDDDGMPPVAVGAGAAAAARGPLFLLQTEISSIYKRGGKVRKVHNLVFAPTLEDADRLSQRLAQIGNLASDGRPILGLDSRDLLEIVLECVPAGVLIPAHVWTPWFALFGSKSGFDRLEDCFGDLSSHIFALETGLSSDPAMNRLVSRLDGYALISNSDAHSGANLGREANLFEGRPSYGGIFAALRAAARREAQDGLECRFLGTLEFYPDEGKYHLDGHRACKVALEPREALALGNICPVCGKPLTVGVLHRVLELADRTAPPALAREPEARPLIPLAEVVGEILGVGASSRRVQERYASLLSGLGPELDILCRLPEADIRRHWEPLGEAVARMRRGQVFRRGGYDGEYGVVRVFAPDELADARGGRLPGLAGRKPGRPSAKAADMPLLSAPGNAANAAAVRAAAQRRPAAPPSFAWTDEQRQAMEAGPGPVLVLAGPGAGKTRVLVGRLQRLLEQGADPQGIVAVTFTRRAAGELRERLSAALPHLPPAALPRCDTLHGLAWGLLRAEAGAAAPQLLNGEAAFSLFHAANADMPQRAARRLWDALNLARETDALAHEPADSPLRRAAARYAARKQAASPSFADYADLLDWWREHARRLSPGRHLSHLLVDEVQDLSPVQTGIVRSLLPDDGKGFFGIGDPDQAIYGFRGASGQSEAGLRAIWPDLAVFRLGRSHRSSQGVLDMARGLLGGGQCGPLTAARDVRAELRLFTAADEQAEARWVARQARRLLGATAHSLLDQSAPGDDLAGTLAPGDIAVLVRLRAQMPPLRAALEQMGVPCAAPAEEPFARDPACARLLALLAPRCGVAYMPLAPDAAPLAEARLPDAWDLSLPDPQGMAAWLQGQAWAGDVLLQGRPWRQFRRLWQECGGWQPFFERLAWLREAELTKARAQHVQILTLHAAKGLEFQAVFLPGLEDGLLPLKRAALFGPGASDPGGEADPAEERRLLYVGLTRAARAIYCSHCVHRTLHGARISLPPSPFVDRIRRFCRHSALAAHARREGRQMSLL